MIEQPYEAVHRFAHGIRDRWTAADIRAEIIRRGSTPSRVAVEAGMSANAGCACLRSTRYVRAEVALAAFLGVHPEALWPERYAPGSSPARSSTRQEALHERVAGRSPDLILSA